MGLQEQRPGGRITGHDIRILLEEQFQVACCLNSVYNLLARLDLVWITVRSKHPKQSQASQDTFNPVKLPILKTPYLIKTIHRYPIRSWENRLKISTY
jgi:hypothetical protein